MIASITINAAGSSLGWELGEQTAAASLGVTAGSAAGGLLFRVAGVRGASFVPTAALALLGLLLSFGLPWLRRKLANTASPGVTA